MIVPAAVSAKHAFVRPYVDEVGKRVRDIVTGFSETMGYPFLGRAKSLNSLAEKLESGRYGQWSQLDDLYACAIIVPTLSHEPAVLEFLRVKFIEVDCRLRASSMKDPEVFRFDSTRFIGALREEHGMASGISDIRFEVQVRTAFEHAWSVTTHALSYKGGNVGWKHKRVAAQLRAAVEQLDQVVLGYQEWAEIIREQNWPVVDEQLRIAERFRSWVADGLIPLEVQPESWVRFSENFRALVAASMRRDPDAGHSKNVDIALEAVGRSLREKGNTYPMSLSLYQYSLGVLCEAEVVVSVNKRYSPVVTNEVETLFPKVQDLKCKPFDFEA